MQKKRWLGLALVFVGVIAVPPVLAVADGISAQFSETKTSSSQRLIDSYEDMGPEKKLSLTGYPDWLDDLPAKCGADYSEIYKKRSADSILDRALAFEGAWDAQYRRNVADLRAEAVTKLTTRFERTLLSDCLSTPLYRGLCRSYVRGLIASADDQSRRQRETMVKSLDSELTPIRCSFFVEALREFESAEKRQRAVGQ